MDSEHIAYVQRLIGMPWERRGMHCWALVDRVERDLFGRALPLGPSVCPDRETRRELLAVDAEDYGWIEIPSPSMARSRACITSAATLPTLNTQASTSPFAEDTSCTRISLTESSSTISSS